MVAGGAGGHCRARMLSPTSALQAPQSSASAQARLDRLQPVLLNRREDPHELPVTVVATNQPSPYAAERAGQLPALEGRAVPQRAGLLRQNRHVVPRIVDDLAAPEAAGMLGDGLAVLADDDPIGVGPHVDRPPDGTGGDAVVVVVEAHQTGLGHRHLGGVEAVEGAAIGHQEGPLLLEHLPHRLALDRRMRPLLGVLDTPIHQPRVDLGIGAAPRDRFIGWTPQLREKNLPLVVDNPRFLILPWIEIPNLGSHILAIIRRRLPDDWTERYNTTPVLIETFVETPRYTGAVYRASGWTRVGTTQGRGRYDRDRQSDKPKKDVWLRPLRRDWKRTLNR